MGFLIYLLSPVVGGWTGKMGDQHSRTLGNTFLVRSSEKPRKSGNPPLPLEGERSGEGEFNLFSAAINISEN
jgi:hypothetical protein